MFTLEQGFAFDAIDTRGDGFLHIAFVLTQPGVFTYHLDGKTVRALKAPDEWIGDSFLASARSVPMTLEHPASLVTPATMRDIVGTADSGPATVHDGMVRHGGTLQHPDALSAVRLKRIKAVSAGTHVEWTANSGTFVAADGTRHDYDVVQTKPRLNHIALTESPRLKNARILSLDSDGAAVWVPDSDFPMEEITKLLQKFSLDSGTLDALKTLIADRDAQLAASKTQLDTLRGERDAFKAKFEAAPSLDSLTAQVGAELKTISAIAAKVPGLSLDALAGAKSETERYKMALDALKVAIPADASTDYMRAAFDIHTGLKAVVHPNSARAGLMAQDTAKPGLTPAQRIAAVQERERRMSRGEKI